MVVVVVVVVVANVVGIFGTTIGFVGFFCDCVVVVTTVVATWGFFVIVCNGFLVVGFGGEMVMSTRGTSASVDTGRRVVVGGLVLFPWVVSCSCTAGFFVDGFFRGGTFADVVVVTNGALVGGRLVITEMGLRVVAIVVVGRLVLVITAVWSVLTVWNVVNSSCSIVIMASWFLLVVCTK